MPGLIVPVPRLFRSQILRRLNNSPPDDTINRGPPPACSRAQKDPPDHLRVLFGGLRKNKSSQRALKVSVFRVLKLDTVGKKKEEETERWTAVSERVAKGPLAEERGDLSLVGSVPPASQRGVSR